MIGRILPPGRETDCGVWITIAVTMHQVEQDSTKGNLRRRPGSPASQERVASPSQGPSAPATGMGMYRCGLAAVAVFSIRQPWTVRFLVGVGLAGVLRVVVVANYPSDVFTGMVIGGSSESRSVMRRKTERSSSWTNQSLRTP
jgi:hypothetical protein